VIVVEVAESVDDALCEAVSTLIPQLSSSAPPPSMEHLRRVIGDPATTLLLARDDGYLVGMLTLAAFALPTGMRAWIEDVVVDDASRGLGVATQLVQAALFMADALGAHTVDLTSRPEREAANRLYVHLGFEPRSTNVFRFTLDGEG
jgi:ribosomal protein S18 acetylase RimI-like enzyme